MENQLQWSLVYYLIEVLGVPKDSPAAIAITVGGVFLCIVIPYLLGSFNFGLIISKNKYNDDIREHGSGNAGTTNMLRTYGKGAAVLTLLGDMAKAAISVGLGYLILDMSIIGKFDNHIGAAIAGMFVMIGHMFPIFYKFKGGKGVATSAMVVLMIDPISFVFCLTIFLVIVIGTRYVSLGSCMGMIFYPIILNAFHPDNPWAKIMAVCMATLVVFMHRENLKRLTQGKESKICLTKKQREEAAAAAAKAAAAEEEPEPERRPKPTLLDPSAVRPKKNRRRKK